jgi:hypothetical protein
MPFLLFMSFSDIDNKKAIQVELVNHDSKKGIEVCKSVNHNNKMGIEVQISKPRNLLCDAAGLTQVTCHTPAADLHHRQHSMRHRSPRS